MLFERSPERYGRARPAYPEGLWHLLGELGVARPGARVLDLGAGTGQATGPLLRRGARVDAVEPGAGLASHLRAHFPTVHVQVARAEDADYPAASYDGVVCATALHWLDLPTVLPRVRAALLPGGWFVPFWHVFFDPEAQPTPFRAAVDAMFGAPPTTAGTPLDVHHWRDALTRGGLFEVARVETWRWEHHMTSAQLDDLLRTFNGWTEDQVGAAVRAADGLGGSVTEHYTTIAYLCRATPTSDTADSPHPQEAR